MKLSTDQYEFSHGKKPRGRGCWVFEVTVERQDGGAFRTEIFMASGTLGEVKAWAVRSAREQNPGSKVVGVEVLP